MTNLKDTRTKIFPSTTRGGKELPSSSALDSPSVLSKLATPTPAINSDMSQVIDDAISAMHDAYDDTTALLDNTVPLGEFLDEQLARAKDIENAETDDISETDEILETKHFETPARPSSPRYELPVIPEGYVMDGEVARDFLACKDRDDLKKLLCKWKEKSLNARMQYDPKFATSPIFVTDKDYEFSVDPELITVVESDPFHGYESETVVAHLTKLNDIATLFAHEEKFAIAIFLSCFLSH
jgi:hypothetical protein